MIIHLPDDILYLIYSHLTIDKLKSLLIIRDLQASIKRYLYTHSTYILSMTKNTQTIPGLQISHLDENTMYHIQRFRNYHVNIFLSHFDDMKDLWETYQRVIVRLCMGEGKNIKLQIRLRYEDNSFSDVKNCLESMEEVSKWFGGGKNIVRCDFFPERLQTASWVVEWKGLEKRWRT